MGKLKTIKAAVKRVRVTKTGKILHKTCGQDHFNSAEPGQTTRAKRRSGKITNAFKRNVARFVPHA